jgi:hypothetical protein
MKDSDLRTQIVYVILKVCGIDLVSLRGLFLDIVHCLDKKKVFIQCSNTVFISR